MDSSDAIKIQLTVGPLPPRSLSAVAGAGALLCFEGVVRGMESDRAILALDYEAYEPMTSRELGRLAEDILRRPELIAVDVEHSVGRIPVGAVSFRLQIASRHRAAALAAMAEFIDRMKAEVPLWKVPVWAESGVAHG